MATGGRERTSVHTHRFLGRALLRLSRYDEAEEQFKRALALCQHADPGTAADIHRAVAWSRQQGGRPSEALQHAKQAHQLYYDAGDPVGQGKALNNMAWLYTTLGEHQKALDLCRQALDLQSSTGDRFGAADTWDTLGLAHHHVGEYVEAITSYKCALALFRAEGDRANEAETLTNLGDTHHAAGDRKAARDAWTYARDILEQLGHPDAAKVRAKLYGDLLVITKLSGAVLK